MSRCTFSIKASRWLIPCIRLYIRHVPRYLATFFLLLDYNSMTTVIRGQSLKKIVGWKNWGGRKAEGINDDETSIAQTHWSLVNSNKFNHRFIHISWLFMKNIDILSNFVVMWFQYKKNSHIVSPNTIYFQIDRKHFDDLVTLVEQ